MHLPAFRQIRLKPEDAADGLDSDLRRPAPQRICGMICPSSRATALVQLGEFLPHASLYARDRNHVKPGHLSVSRLGPAIRHRLITEEEVAAAVLQAHPFGRVEKFIQEVYWRRYWKSWLALRPQVWKDYLKDVTEMEVDPAVRRVEEAHSGNAVIDHFAAELVTTGYLHNHARMWFAAWWVHEARLPWQSGANFFFRHLLDGDPASNTLSWRWVAGLHTPGKTYLARRGNLEKYMAPELLDALSDGLETFENPQPIKLEYVSKPPITRMAWPLEIPDRSGKIGLWIHEEDLSVESSALGEQSFSSVIVTADLDTWERYQFSSTKRQWTADALQDAANRAERHWKAPVVVATHESYHAAILRWAKTNNLQQVATLRPEIGPLDDSVPELRASLAQAGVCLILIDRTEDLQMRPLGTGGFFQFWERLRKT